MINRRSRRKFMGELIGGLATIKAASAGARASGPTLPVAADERNKIVLPELLHDKTVSQHPKWIKDNLRIAYAHWERVKQDSLDDWARRCKGIGATVLMALGNIPDDVANHVHPRVSVPAGVPYPSHWKPKDWRPDYRWVTEYATTAHKHGLKCVIYVLFSIVLDETLVAHPDWRELDEAGKPYMDMPCYSSPFWEGFQKRMQDIARGSHIDGIMIDMFSAGPKAGCRNPYCLRAFEKRFGVPAPDRINPTDPVYQRWIDFQAFIREEAMLRLTEGLHTVNPEFAVIVNQHRGLVFNIAVGGQSNFETTKLHEFVDGQLEETGWMERAVAWTNPFGFPIKDSFQNTFLRSRQGSASSFMWYLSYSSPLAELRARNFNMLAHGVVPCPVIGSVLDWSGILFEDIRQREKWILHSEALPWLGIAFSEDTLAWRYKAVDDAHAHPYIETIFGAVQAACEAHLPTDILADWQLKVNDLRRYRVILLPNTAALSDAACKALSEYVEQGGGLVVTYETSFFDEQGQQRSDFGLGNLFGLSKGQSNRRPRLGITVCGSTHPIAQGEIFRRLGVWTQGAIRPADYFDVTASRSGKGVGYTTVRWHEGTSNVNGRTWPDPPGEGAMGKITKLPPPALPAFVAREVGRGRVVYFPADLTRAYFLDSFPATQHLLVRAIHWAAQEPPPVEIDAAEQVEMICFTKQRRLIVHLLNDMASYGRCSPPNPESFSYRRDVLPLANLKVRLNGDVDRVLLVPGERELPLQRRKGGAEVLVPELGLHAMLVIEWQIRCN